MPTTTSVLNNFPNWNVTFNGNDTNTTSAPREIPLEDFDYVRNIKFHLLVVILPFGLIFNCFSIGVYG